MTSVPERIRIINDDEDCVWTWDDKEAPEDSIPFRRDDQVCVWRPSQFDEFPEIIVYVPSCDYPTGMAEPTYPYCPFCGNRIRVEEAECETRIAEQAEIIKNDDWLLKQAKTTIALLSERAEIADHDLAEMTSACTTWKQRAETAEQRASDMGAQLSDGYIEMGNLCERAKKAEAHAEKLADRLRSTLSMAEHALYGERVLCADERILDAHNTLAAYREATTTQEET